MCIFNRVFKIYIYNFRAFCRRYAHASKSEAYTWGGHEINIHKQWATDKRPLMAEKYAITYLYRELIYVCYTFGCKRMHISFRWCSCFPCAISRLCYPQNEHSVWSLALLIWTFPCRNPVFFLCVINAYIEISVIISLFHVISVSMYSFVHEEICICPYYNPYIKVLCCMQCPAHITCDHETILCHILQLLILAHKGGDVTDFCELWGTILLRKVISDFARSVNYCDCLTRT